MFVVLFLIAFVLLLSGGGDDTPAEVLASYNDDEATLVVAFFLLVASAIAYVAFVAAVRSALGGREGERRGLIDLGFGAGLVTAGVLIVAVAPIAALTDAADTVGANAAGAFYIVNGLAYPLLTSGIAVSSLLALATGLVALQTGALPRWLGWFSLVAAPIILVAILFIPIFVFLAWVTAVSAALVLQGPRRELSG
jgi:hypothetical protein